MLTAALLGALGALAGTLAAVERRRRAVFLTAAKRRGWSYAGRDPLLILRWESWPFNRGRHRRARHVLRGGFGGHRFVAFEYSCRQRVPGGPEGPAEAVSTWGVLAIALPGRLPRLAVNRKGPLGRLAVTLGRQDLQLESEDFNRRFAVRTDDPRVAFHVLNPRTMAVLLDGPFFEFRLESADALSCWPGRLRLEDVDQRLPFLTRVVDGIPGYLWKDGAQ